MLKAVQSNKVETVRRLQRRGIGWSERMQKQLSYEAAHLGHMEALACLHELGCAWHPETCLAAAKGGHLDALAFLHEHGCPWVAYGREREPWTAIERGDVAMFKYLCEKGCEVTPKHHSYGCLHCIAASRGHVHMLKHLVENKFPMTSMLIFNATRPFCGYVAAAHGHINCLVYLQDQGYQWNEHTVTAAACHVISD